MYQQTAGAACTNIGVLYKVFNDEEGQSASSKFEILAPPLPPAASPTENIPLYVHQALTQTFNQPIHNQSIYCLVFCKDISAGGAKEPSTCRLYPTPVPPHFQDHHLNPPPPSR